MRGVGPGARRALRKMPVQRNPHRPVIKAHLKLVGISKTTRILYNKAFGRFFVWGDANAVPQAQSYEELEDQLGEFFLYQRDRPLNHAGDCLAGFKRLHPRTKRHLATDSQFLNNWVKVTKQKALPVSGRMVKAMAAYALANGEKRFAISLLIGYAGLLRTAEIVNLRIGDFNVLRQNAAIIALRDTKSAKRAGSLRR